MALAGITRLLGMAVLFDTQEDAAMATTPDSQNHELSVTDFGPISKAKIDLRPLTVFVGPSNTGKSYMAVLIYAMHQFFSDLYRLYRMHMMQRQSLDLSKNDLSGLYAWAKETLSDLETIESLEPSLIELPESIATLIRKSLKKVTTLSEILDNEIARCFGVGKTKNLIRHSGDGETTFSLLHNISKETELNNPFGYQVTVTEQGAKINAPIPNTMPLQMNMKDILDLLRKWNSTWLIEMENIGLREEGSADASKWDVEWLVEMQNMGLDKKAEQALNDLLISLADFVAPDMVGSLRRPAHYLPADRAGVMHAHQVAVRGLIASASRVALRRDSPMPLLSGVLGDFLEQLVELASSTRWPWNTQGDNDLALRMEQALLRGTIHVERSEIDYPSFVYRPEGWEKDLPLMNASSMVSELAPVVLYLRHVVRPGNLLIIEEPESHLHPAMQVEFVRQLALAVKSGIRILITTHSEWVLEELANLVRLSELPAERRGGIDDPDVELRPEEIGAWLFERGSKNSGSVVREMPLDVESGTFSSGFGLITEGLYNRWAEISNRIEEE